MRHRKLFSLLTIAVLATLTACNRSQPQSVRVGSILGLSGNNAMYGQLMQRGFTVALDEINQSPQGPKFELVAEDSQFDPGRAVSAYRKLTAAQGIRLIVGITGSRNAIPVCEASSKDDVLILDPLGSAPKLTTVGGPNYFRVMPSDAFAGRYNIDWAIQNGMKRPGILFVQDDWGTSYMSELVHYLAEKGLNNVPTYPTLSGTRDFRSEVQKIRAAKIDSLFLLLYAKEGATFMQQLREAKLLLKVYGSDNVSSADFTAAGGDAIDGVFVALPAKTQTPAFDAFARAYRARYKEDPDASVAKSYDALKLMAAAVAKVGSDPAKLRAYLHSPDFSYDGITGRLRFDEHGDLVGQQYQRMVYHGVDLQPLQ